MSSKQKDVALKTVCIRQKQNFGVVTGILTREQRLLKPWEEVEIFPGPADELLAALVKAEDKAIAAREVEETARREAGRACEHKRCSPALSKTELLQFRPDAELIEMAKDEPPINEVCTSAYMKHDPEFFMSQLFNDDDLVSVVHTYGGDTAHPFAEIRKNLGALSAINVNRLARGEAPPRKRVVVKFGTSYWRRLSFLTRSGEMMLLVCGASDGLYAVFDCEKWPQKRLVEFAKQAVHLDGEVVERMPTPGALTSSLSGTVYQFLHRGGFVRDQLQFKPRNHVLYWRAPGEPLPTVPPRGRRT